MGWNFGPYTLNTIYYSIDHTDNDLSYYQVNVSSATDDTLEVHVERDQTGGMIITDLKGALKNTKINISKPFYINNNNKIIIDDHTPISTISEYFVYPSLSQSVRSGTP